MELTNSFNYRYTNRCGMSQGTSDKIGAEGKQAEGWEGGRHETVYSNEVGSRDLFARLAGGVSTSIRFTRDDGLGRNGFGLDYHRILGQGLKFRVHPDICRRLDTKSHAVAADFENSNFDVVGNDDLLISLPTDDKHSPSGSLEAATTAENT